MNQTNNKIVISIITPCYNAAPYIATTIKSVQQQTFTDWEMIVVDDGSTDNSAHIVSARENGYLSRKSTYAPLLSIRSENQSHPQDSPW